MPLAAQAAAPQFPYAYHFTLTKGAGTPVCKADLKRLNTATYTGPPSCDQPQATKVPGFTPLHRVPLSTAEVYALFVRVNNLMTFGKQGSQAQDEALAAQRKRLHLLPLSQRWPFHDVAGYVRRGYIKVWRYDPPVSIDNDGKPTRLIIWQGIPVSTVPGVCGVPSAVGSQTVYFQPQVAFVLDASHARLDVARTKAIFGHPGGNYRFRNGTVLPGFEPIGLSMGIFKYRRLYYFDTFFWWWGDFHDRHVNDLALRNTLGVFLRRNGHTHEVCEYHRTQRRRPTPEDTP
ncbi:MAG: hypothetical protein ACYDAZ_08760 [Thermoplasmataceae archaeon]